MTTPTPTLVERAQCRKCGETKPREEFKPEPRVRSGLASTCKACVNAYHAERRSKPDEKAKDDERRRRWYANGGNTKASKAARARRANGYQPPPPDPAHVRARSLAQSAIRHGKIKRQPCESCGNPTSEAHHDDYTKPLDVRFFCRPCHRRHHVEVGHAG